MIAVRRFRPSDYRAVLDLDRAEQRTYRGERWDAASEVERERFLMTSPRYQAVYASSEFCLVAEDDGALVGFLFALPLLPDVIEIDGVGVTLGRRRQGVGKAMYDALIKAARDRGVRRIQAFITPDNEPSMALHWSAGFRLRDRKEAVLEL
jgi:L-amino acid N-acyltransferase YncA